MSSPGQRRGTCGHVMASLDSHLACACCSLQLSTPSYKIKKDKREAKKLESTPSKDTESLVNPSDVAILGAVDLQGTVKSPPTVAPPPTSKAVKPTASSSMVDSKIAHLDEKWSNRFNRLEALLLARTIEPTFQSNVKVAQAHSPPASAVHPTELFIRPVQPVPASTEFPGSGSSA